MLYTDQQFIYVSPIRIQSRPLDFTQQGFIWNYYTLHRVVDHIMGRVYYHYPGDKQFSLYFVNPDPNRIVSEIIYDDDVAMEMRQCDLDEEFYVVYTSRVGGGAVKDLDFSLTDALERMEPDTGVIVTRFLEIYRGTVK